MDFKDYFSAQARAYAQFRPRYPRALFAYLADAAPARGRAWDCATGNGQTAVALAEFFAEVIATDGSQHQLDQATPHERVIYRRAVAEDCGLADESCDLVTVSQALHWLDLDKFYGEARRVLRPQGALAVWCYELLTVTPEIDARLNSFYRDVTGPYWAPERVLVETGYRTLSFPFDELTPPPFEMTARWTLPQFIGYVSTWSATQNYVKTNRRDPLPAFGAELLTVWGAADEAREIRWPLSLRVGRRA
jgi:ubiquinone/menaquinone biosynthesis C-methylase UbiE